MYNLTSIDSECATLNVAWVFIEKSDRSKYQLFNSSV